MGKVVPLGLAIGFFLATASLRAADDVPYKATITAGEVYVRSGPGKDYYPTDKLKKGERVEVYRHDPGGWCAIRPPAGSFSWVSARQVEQIGDGLARSTGDRVVSRVGSSFSEIRDVIQIRLKKGETVELVSDHPPEDAKWVKIHPPSGEFRWISARFIEPVDPSRGRKTVQVEPDDEQDVDLAGEDEPRRLHEFDERNSDQRNLDEHYNARRGSHDIELASRQEPVGETSDWQLRKRRSIDSLSKSGSGELLYPLSKEIDSIELELSAMVTEEITAWSFQRVRQRAERALDASATAIERGRVRNVLAKIDRFAELKQRHDAVSTARIDTDRRDRMLASPAPATRSDDAPKFDGSGRLTPVVSSKVGAPQFALVDERGAVTVFLSAAPGVNLRSYVDKQIGVNGPRGFIPDLQKQHINVQRVTQTDTAR